MNTFKEYLFVFLSFLFVILVLVGGWVGKSYFEANSYNNVTGKHVSTWDAMFLELRIVD